MMKSPANNTHIDFDMHYADTLYIKQILFIQLSNDVYKSQLKKLTLMTGFYAHFCFQTLIIICKYRGVASFHASSALDSGAVTCSSRRILQIKDGGVHASVESVQQRGFSLHQSRFKRALPALLPAASTLLLQRLRQSVAAQRQGFSLRADSAALSEQRLL